MESLYPEPHKNCVCKGTGLITISESPKRQSYCPMHKMNRRWPQLQPDGSIKLIWISQNALEGYKHTLR